MPVIDRTRQPVQGDRQQQIEELPLTVDLETAGLLNANDQGREGVLPDVRRVDPPLEPVIRRQPTSDLTDDSFAESVMALARGLLVAGPEPDQERLKPRILSHADGPQRGQDSYGGGAQPATRNDFHGVVNRSPAAKADTARKKNVKKDGH
ncbi:MAG: hypothetical protein KY476_14395 [Planctomycetes bacterium]|nr:hypothetical protein [Planctomycetota bacterium]